MKSVAIVTHLHIHSDWRSCLSKKSVSWSRYLEQIQPCLVSLVYFLIYGRQSTTGLYPLQKKNCYGWIVHNTFQILPLKSSQTSKIFWDTAALRAHHRKSVQLTYFKGGGWVSSIFLASIEATMPLTEKKAWSEENNKGVEVAKKWNTCAKSNTGASIKRIICSYAC